LRAAGGSKPIPYTTLKRSLLILFLVHQRNSFQDIKGTDEIGDDPNTREELYMWKLHSAEGGWNLDNAGVSNEQFPQAIEFYSGHLFSTSTKCRNNERQHKNSRS